MKLVARPLFVVTKMLRFGGRRARSLELVIYDRTGADLSVERTESRPHYVSSRAMNLRVAVDLHRGLALADALGDEETVRKFRVGHA